MPQPPQAVMTTSQHYEGHVTSLTGSDIAALAALNGWLAGPGPAARADAAAFQRTRADATERGPLVASDRAATSCT